MSEFKEVCEVIWNSSFFWGWFWGVGFSATLFHYSRRRTKPTVIRTYDTDKYAFVLKLCAHVSGCTVEQVDAQIVKVMSEQPMEKS